MPQAVYRWIRIALLNLLIVSVLGVLMRYKIAYSFPFVEQKFILHAHSHFAFAGWVTQVLMALMVQYLVRFRPDAFASYKPLLLANLITAYGMLLSFPFQGYGFFSITFSTLNIFTAYWFGVKYWRDLSATGVKENSHVWFKAAVVFNFISSIGPFWLAYMMATKNLHQNLYLAAVYFFLHFQYNGWFFFVCMGLFSDKLKLSGANIQFMKRVFLLFAVACLPAYFLSALWLPIPNAVYVMVVLAALSQSVGAIIFFKAVWKQKNMITVNSTSTGNWLISLSAIALAIKLLLQLGSTIPSLSTLAFGFRPIVIGYLHLVLLAVITLFLLGYMISKNHLRLNKTGRYALNIFTAGIVLNEILLMIQGISAMDYEAIPYMDVMLLAAGLVMFTGLLCLNLSMKKNMPVIS